MQIEKTVEGLDEETGTLKIELKYDPERNRKQLLFHQSPEMYKLFGGAMGGGKTAALINEGQMLGFDYPGNFGLLLRKTLPSFIDTVLPQLEKFVDRRTIYGWNETKKYIYYRNGSRIRYGGLGEREDDWDKFMSGEYGWIALDQAEQFTEEQFIMLATRLRLNLPGIRYFFLLSCNPNVGWIKERFLEKNLEDHTFIPSLPEDNKQNLPKNYIPNMKKILTPLSYKALMKGDWEAVGEPDNVYVYLDVRAAMKRRVKPSLPLEIGVDVARSERHTSDETVITLREGLRVEIYKTSKGVDLMKTAGDIWKLIAERILPRWKEEGIETSKEKKSSLKISIKVDADGLGSGVVDRLKEQRGEKQSLCAKWIMDNVSKERKKNLAEEKFRVYIKIIEIHGAGKPKDPIKFKNVRSEIHWGLRELLEIVSLPNDRELLTQLMSIKYDRNSAGQLFIIPKDKIKEKLGRSPDQAESVIYSLADIKPVSDPRITRL